MIKIRNIMLLCLSLLIFFTVSQITEAGNVPYSPPSPNMLKIIYRDIHGLSTEGGYLQAILSGDKIKYLYVRIFGETFQSGWSYSFVDDSVIIAKTRENYNQPFFIDPESVHVESIERERFLLLDNRLYRISQQSDEMNEVTEEIRDEVIGWLNILVEIATTENE